MASVETLIDHSSKGPDKEMERELIVIVKFKYHGKLSHGWQHVRTLLRRGQLLFGNSMTVYLQNGEEITFDQGATG